jgi:hypothetical protein
MSDIIQKIDEALASLRREHPRAHARTIGYVGEMWPRAAVDLARVIGRAVVIRCDGGAVPGAYRYRADADLLEVRCYPDGTADVCATRTWARKVSGGDSGGWRAMVVSGGADLADTIRPHLPKGTTRRDGSELEIRASVHEVRALIAALSGAYTDAADALAADAARDAARSHMLGEHLPW